MEYNVIFQPSGRRGKIEEDKTLLEASRELGVDIENTCGGAGTCKKCMVKIEEGYFEKFNIDSKMSNLSDLSAHEKRKLTEEQVEDNIRFACHAKVNGDVLVFVPEESRGANQVVLETGKERVFNLNPAVKNYYVEMGKATLADERGDWERLQQALTEKYGELDRGLTIDYFALKTLPNSLREGDWKITASIWNDKEVISVNPGLVEKAYGVAVDIGTTTVAAYLLDLKSGALLSKKSMMNPQVRYGEDVLSRITYSMMNEDGLEKMHDAIIQGLNDLIVKMTGEAEIIPAQVAEVVLVFNTAMHHIALGLEPKHMGRSPFAPAVKQSLNIKSRDMGINVNPAANVHVLPIEAGFVGPDNMGVMIAEEPYMQKDEMRLLIDIGTNGEIDLGNSDKMLCTSCATGPALEGAQIKFGMRAAPGAIENVEIDPQTYEPRYRVIGKEEWYPDIKKTDSKGICGSGIIDVIAEMFKAGIFGKTGRINKKLETPRVRKGADGKMEYVLAWADETSIGKDITVTQGDIRAVQLAKSALYVGAKYLMEKLGVEKIDSVTLAGAFGSYINTESALAIGMFPDCELEKIVAVGNAAGDGAQVALLDKDKRDEAQRVAKEVEFVETAVEPDFQQRFADAMGFPHSKDEFPNLEKVLKANADKQGKAVNL